MTIPADYLTVLKARYGEPWRHYHTWDHIRALKRHYDAWPVTLNHPEAVLAALYWHDAIWFPDTKDDEERSAQLLEVEAGYLSLEDRRLAGAIIRATAKHVVPSDLSDEDQADMMAFLDMDLSILGTPSEVFDLYDDNVGREYAHIPAEFFRKGRGAVLQSFLSRDHLYFTPHGRDMWEAQARSNLQRTIKKLSE